MIIESAVEMAIPRIMQKTDCTLLREEEISSMLSKGCEAFLRLHGVPNGTSYIEVEKLYPKSKNRNAPRADLFIDKEAIINFKIQTPELYHHTWIECKFLKHSVKKWNIIKLITDIRKVITKGRSFAYLIILFHHDLSKHTQDEALLKELQNALLSVEKLSSLSLFDYENDLENDQNLPSLNQDAKRLEIKLRRSFSDVFPIKFMETTKFYRFVTLKIHADKYTSMGNFF